MIQKQETLKLTYLNDATLSLASRCIKSHLNQQEDRLGCSQFLINPENDEQVRQKAELLAEIDKLHDAYDVLTVISCHSKPDLSFQWFLKERKWKFVSDVPNELMESGIQTLIEMMEMLKEVVSRPDSRYDDTIELLQKVLAFRKQEG